MTGFHIAGHNPKYGEILNGHTKGDLAKFTFAISDSQEEGVNTA